MNNLKNVTPELIQNYAADSGGASLSTVKRRLSSLRKFFDWAHKEGHVEQNPFPTNVPEVITPTRIGNLFSLSNLVKVGLLAGFSVLAFLFVQKVKIPINFIPGSAQENVSPVAENIVQTPLPAPFPTTVPTATPQATSSGLPTILNALEPTIKTLGNILIEGKAINLQTAFGSGGDITLHPDTGKVNLLFDSNNGNLVNATAANLNSGSLFYGLVGNNSTGYNLLTLQSGSNPTTKFSVDSQGNTTTTGNVNLTGGDLQIGGVTRLNSMGRLASITGYYQGSGLFKIDQGSPDTATIIKTPTTAQGSATGDVMALKLDETNTTGSTYNTLTLDRINPASGGYALKVKTGDVSLAGNITTPNGTTIQGDGIGTDNLTFQKYNNVSVTGSGTISLNGNLTLGSATSNTISATGRFNTNIVPSLTASVDLGCGTCGAGSTPIKWNNIWVQTINATGTNTSGQASFTYDPANTGFSESSVLINPTTANTDETLLGIGLAGVEKAGIDVEGDLAVGYSSSTAPVLSNPFNVFNHGTTSVATIDASGNLTLLAGAKLQPTADSTSALNIANAAGSSFINFDTTNQRQVFISGTLLDLSANTHGTTAIQGLKLPQGATLSNPTSGAGYLAYNSTSQQIQVYNGTSWVAAGGASGTGASGQATFWTGTSAISGDNNFFWDNTNKRLGIGTALPAAPLQITDGTNAKINIEKTGSLANVSNIYNDGNLHVEAGSGRLWLNGNSTIDITLANGGGNVGIGLAVPTGKLHVSGAVIGKALTVFNETGDQNILTASASGVTQYNFGRTGNLSINGVFTGLSSSVNTRLQATGTTSGSTGNGSIYFLDSSGTTRGRVDTTLPNVSNFGTGADGAMILSSPANINITVIAPSRSTYADGIAYKVSSDPTGGSSIVTTDTPNGIAAGDELLLIDLQGTAADTAAVGNYEFLRVSTVNTGTKTITTTTAVAKSYTGTSFANQKVIIQRVPNYTNVTINSGGSLTASAWDALATIPAGAAGYLTGIVAFRASGTVTVIGSISTSSLGWRGGPGAAGVASGKQGESRTGIGTNSSAANDGGGGCGGNCSSTGGGGAGGGYGNGPGGAGVLNSPGGTGTVGGTAGLSQVFYGSGGGAGFASNNSGTGGIGGGIILVGANTFSITGSITSNGQTGLVAGTTGSFCGAGAGGAGGTVYIVGYTINAGTNLMTASAGSGGAQTGCTTNFNGGAGSTGRIRIEYTGVLNGTTSPSAATQSSVSSQVQSPTSSSTLYGDLHIGSIDTINADLAEYYTTDDKTMEPGDVVEIADMDVVDASGSAIVNKGVLNKANSPYDSKLIGIISTSPGVTLGSIDGSTGQAGTRALTLSGRVPVKIDPDSDPILIGDFLTSSDKPGLAKKATKAGYTVAKALEVWNKDMGKDRIEAFVNLGYFEPSIALTDDGNIKITQVGNTNQIAVNTSSPSSNLSDTLLSPIPSSSSGTLVNSSPAYQVQNAVGEVIDRIGTFGKLVTGNLRAGLTETENLIAKGLKATSADIQNLIADNVTISKGLVSPLVETSFISPVPEGKDIAIQVGNTNSSESGRLAILDRNKNELASVDEGGNASFSGQTKTNDLAVSNNATISGSLYADNIKSKSLDDIEKLLKNVAIDQKMLSASSSWNVNTATMSPDLNVANIYVTNKGVFNALSSNQIFTNSLDSLTSPLSIQPLAMQPVEIMAGKIKINTNGDVEINGNLNVAGNINIHDGFGKIIADIDSSGSAQFKDLKANQVIIASDSVATASALVNGEITTNATAGTATIPSGVDGITIKNNKITDYTLVYVTPTSSTNNQVLYVKSKGNGFFKVGFTQPDNIDVTFNWWVIDVK